MKKLLCLLMMLTLLLSLAGCGSPAEPDSSKKADGDTENTASQQKEIKTYPLKHSSKYYEEADEVNPLIFTTKGSENNLQGAVYLLEGTVAELLKIDAGESKVSCFFLDTEDGRVLVNDMYSTLVSSFLGSLYAEDDADYTLPAKGEKIKVYVTYSGYSETYQMPSCYFGASEYLVEDALSERKEEVKLEIAEEYALAGYLYTQHFLVIRNDGESTQEVSTSSLGYDKEGNLLGSAESIFSVTIAPGETALLQESFDVSGVLAYCKITINSQKSRYESANKYLKYQINDIPGGAVIQMTNTGEKSISFVKGMALYIKDGVVVDYEEHYFGDFSLEAGATANQQYSTKKEYDTFKFYPDGDLY